MEYQIVQEMDTYLLLRREDGRLERKFLFTLQPHVLADYAGMCVYHQTSPHSSFTYRRVCSRATPTGRITLTGTSFIRTDSGNRFETQIVDEQEFVRVLKESFGIELPDFLVLGQTKTAGP